MTTGELRDRVVFYAPDASTDALRGQAVTYTREVANLACAWKNYTAREALMATAMDVVPTYRVTIHYRGGITTALRAERVGGDEGVCQVVGVTDTEGARRFLDVDLVKVL